MDEKPRPSQLDREGTMIKVLWVEKDSNGEVISRTITNKIVRYRSDLEKRKCLDIY